VEQTLRKRLKELEKNGNTVIVRVAGSIASVGLITGTVKGVREDHIILLEGSANHMLPLKKIETIDY